MLKPPNITFLMCTRYLFFHDDEWMALYPTQHARVEGGMSKKKSPVVVTGINVLFECK